LCKKGREGGRVHNVLDPCEASTTVLVKRVVFEDGDSPRRKVEGVDEKVGVTREEWEDSVPDAAAKLDEDALMGCRLVKSRFPPECLS
jgi:hypothetical protein